MDADPWADAPSSRPTTPVAALARVSLDHHSSPLAAVSTPSSPLDDTANESLPKPEASMEHMDVQDAVEITNAAVKEEEEESKEEAKETDQVGQGGEDAFDDFDDFDEPAQAGPSSGGIKGLGIDDTFDDFGDFDEGGFEDVPPIQEEAGGLSWAEPEPEPEVQTWRALRLDPFPTKGEIVEQLIDLLRPIRVDEGGLLTDEPPRQVGGLSQIMITESSREAYAQLTTPPMLKTLDWTRSRVRRDHLISMGVPVNLDEVDSHRLSSLPPLRITTSASHSSHPSKRASTDSYRHNALDKGKGRDLSAIRDGSQSVPVSAVNGTSGDRKEREKYGLGQRPILDSTKAEDLCGVEEEQLSLMSLEKLRALQEDLVQTSSAASSLLAWHLQYKDAQAQDSATYNGMISELISNAAKAKSASTSSGGVFKRASIRRPQSGSPAMSPRIGSPSLR